MRSGSEIKALFDAATTTQRVDAVAKSLMASGDVPDFIATNWWKWVTITGGGHTLKILVAPDYMCFGPDDDSFPLARATPYGAQACADYYGAIIPSRKLMRDIQAQASPKIPYLDIKGAPFHVPVTQIETPQATDDMASMRATAFDKFGVDPTDFGSSTVIGYRKCIVVEPNLNGTKVQIYGGRGGAGDPPWNMIQGTSKPPVHDSGYSDYSHGVVLVSRKAELDGDAVDLRTDVFGSNDPGIVSLVSDQGRFDPVFPNAGSGSRAMFQATDRAPASFTKDSAAFGGGGGVAKGTSAGASAGSEGWGMKVLKVGAVGTLLWGLYRLVA